MANTNQITRLGSCIWHPRRLLEKRRHNAPSLTRFRFGKVFVTGNRKNITSSCLRSGQTYTPSTNPADQFAKREKLREGNVTYVSRAAGGPGAST
jgi:hypothetical protein